MVMMQQSPQSSLPPGFRFHPTDEELILHYLHKKLSSSPFPFSIIADVNIYKFDPWDLPAKATFGEKEWYFFSPRDRKYPNGARPNRAARSGYWKATGTDKVISVALPGHASQDNIVIGVKKALVFYKGRPPKGIKTNWIMHEYRLSDSPSYIANPNNKPIRPKDFSSMRLDDWVLCRIYKKSHPNSAHQHHHPQSVTTAASVASTTSDPDQEDDEDHRQRYLVSQPSSKSPTITNQTALWPQKSSFFSNSFDATDYSLLSNFLSDPQFIINPPPPLIEVTDSIVTTTTTTMNQQESNNLGYLHHKVLPDHQSTGMMTSTRPKRDRSNGDQDVSMGTYSKKPMTSNFINASGSYDYDDQYGGFVNQAVLNHNLLMSHHLQFQG